MFVGILRSRSQVGCGHANENGEFIDFGSFFDNAIFIQLFIIVSLFFTHYIGQVGDIGKRKGDIGIGGFTSFFMAFISRHISGFEQTALKSTFIDKGCIFYVITSITHNGNDGIDSVGVIFTIDVFQKTGFEKRKLSSIENNGGFIHTGLIIGMIQRNRLFTLATGEIITIGGVVFQENGQITHHSIV